MKFDEKRTENVIKKLYLETWILELKPQQLNIEFPHGKDVFAHWLWEDNLLCFPPFGL